MSASLQDLSEPGTPDTADTINERTYGAGDRSSADSVFSHDTSATSLTNLPPLQTKGLDDSDAHQLEPLVEDDPRSFDLVDPPKQQQQQHVALGVYALEARADLMFSDRHLHAIFDRPKLLLKFTTFLNTHRPQSIPVLIYYLDALKAIRAIHYANAVAEALDPLRGLDFTRRAAPPTTNTHLDDKARRAFDLLVRDDLPAYIAHVWTSLVSASIQRRITGTLAPHLREASEGLAETFCLSDPSRRDNPIVFASDEFARTTQYGMTYAIGRNCRFLQGPRTAPASVRRLALACAAGRQLTEVFVNYRRDGSPFINLLMIAPLMDSRGNLRYYLGAQVDVSGLLKACSDLPALETLADHDADPNAAPVDSNNDHRAPANDEFQALARMFNGAELDTVRRHGGRMHKEYVDDADAESLSGDRRPRLLLKDPGQDVLDGRDSSRLGEDRDGDDEDRDGGTDVDADADARVDGDGRGRSQAQSQSRTQDLDRDQGQGVLAADPAVRESINGRLEGVYRHVSPHHFLSLSLCAARWTFIFLPSRALWILVSGLWFSSQPAIFV